MRQKVTVRKLNILLEIVTFSVILLFLFYKNAYCSDYNDFNRNVKNYHHNLLIINGDGKNIAKYKVAVAKDKKNRGRGLMNLRHLDAEKGMLFLFKKHAIVTMWMKDTLITLDMIFIKDSKIVWIAKNTTPKSLKHISSKFKVNKVLEINGGQIVKNGIKVGDRIKIKL